MGCVLGQLDESGKKARAIYYLSKKFTEYEKVYSGKERLCIGLGGSKIDALYYMLYYTTWLISKMDPP
jgi:hypothetical protein